MNSVGAEPSNGASDLELAGSSNFGFKQFRNLIAGKRILFVSNEDWAFAAHSGRYVQTLQRLGAHVGVVAPANAASHELRAKGIQVLDWRIQRRSLNPLVEAHAAKQLWTKCKEFRPDLVHALAIKQSIYVGVVAGFMGLPWVSSITGMGLVFSSSELKMKALRATILTLLRLTHGKRNSILTTENPDDRALMLSAGIAEPDRIIRVSGAGVDANLFSESEEPEGIPTVLFASRLVHHKGPRDFVAAAKLLRERGVQARFLLAGTPDPGNPASVSESDIAQWRDEGDVEVLGHRSDIHELMRQSHILCLPTFYREGIPKFLLEGAASGRALVTTDMPGCKDIVRNGVNGLVVPPQNPSALADALQTLISNQELRRRFGRAGRRLVELELRTELVEEQLLEVYSRLLPLHQ